MTRRITRVEFRSEARSSGSHTRLRTLPIVTGVPWNGPSQVPYSSKGISFGSHCQTISNLPTFAAVISSASEYFVCNGPESTYGHSIRSSGSWQPARSVDRKGPSQRTVSRRGNQM